jgi:phosphomannomutase
VVTTLSTSQVVSDAATANGCPVILTPVGEVHVVEAMVAEGAVVGGEGNGGVILTEVDPGRDAAVGVAVLLEVLAESGRPLSELVAALPQYAIEKRKVSCNSRALERAVEGLRDRHPRAFTHPVQDGIKLYLDGSLHCPWIHLRSSNTEPVVRIIAESDRRDQAVALCDEAEGLLRD